MKRTLSVLVAAAFALAAGSSFAQAPAAATPHAKTTKSVKHSHKSTSSKVAHKKAPKTAA
jgi:Ni/Co efflux regulator RcnB